MLVEIQVKARNFLIDRSECCKQNRCILKYGLLLHIK
jgi:hypothetical protein